MKDRAASNS